MLWDIQKEIFCQQLAQISLQRANNCLYSGRFWFKMPKKHKTSQKVAECKVENLLLSNITSTEVYVQYGCNKFQAQLRLRFHTISPIVIRLGLVRLREVQIDQIKTSLGFWITNQGLQPLPKRYDVNTRSSSFFTSFKSETLIRLGLVK